MLYWKLRKRKMTKFYCVLIPFEHNVLRRFPVLDRPIVIKILWRIYMCTSTIKTDDKIKNLRRISTSNLHSNV